MALEVHQQQQPTTTTSSSCRQQNTALQRSVPTTLDLFHSKLSSFPVELDQQLPLPLGWQKFLDLKTGAVYYKDSTEMSRNGKNPKLDLKLHLSPPRRSNWQSEESPKSSSSTSSASSCMSSEAEMGRCPSSPEEAAASMVLVGCPRCLMYVMLSEEDPKCPKCKSTVLLDFLHINYNNTRTTNNNNSSSNTKINNNNNNNTKRI